jgi:hypothetical protein
VVSLYPQQHSLSLGSLPLTHEKLYGDCAIMTQTQEMGKKTGGGPLNENVQSPYTGNSTSPGPGKTIPALGRGACV